MASMTTREKLRQDELPRLAGYLAALVKEIEIDRHVYGQQSYDRISHSTERALRECSDMADRLMYGGLETEMVYHCESCGNGCDELVQNRKGYLVCPECGSEDIQEEGND